MLPESFFKCLADETRLRCLALMVSKGELCVCELTQALDLSQPKISRHLAQLRQCGVLLDSRKGQWVYYAINPELPGWAVQALSAVLVSLKESGQWQLDNARLTDIKQCE